MMIFRIDKGMEVYNIYKNFDK